MALNFGSYLIVLIFAIFLILLWKAAAFIFSQSDVPGPKGNWLTGQLFEIMQTKDMVKTSHEWTKTYGPIVEYRPMGIFGKQNMELSKLFSYFAITHILYSYFAITAFVGDVNLSVMSICL